MEYPILFNTEMVRAILDGRKTQTRRVIKPQPDFSKMRFNGKSWVYMGYLQGHDVEISPYGVRGDVLWVRETWAVHTISHEKPSELFHPQKVWYKADGVHDVERGKWRPSIFMPRWASRISLVVNAVRIEQVQDITDNDAKAEGVTPVPFASGFNDNELHKATFFQLWDLINSKRGYPVERNPFVWVIEFEVVA